jgi:cation transport regulator ChaC
MTLRVFGYGSLMFQPPAPDVVRLEDARLPGYVRAFNKRSVPRACRHADALLPARPGWTHGARRISLALGTRTAPHAHLDGKVLTWPDSHAAAVLAELDRREGVSAPPDAAADGYLRTRLPLADGSDCWVYLTNPDGRWYAELSPNDVADVLARATPTTPGDRALGADYLAGTLGTLRRAGMTDPGLEALARRVRHHLGPLRWTAGIQRFGG